MHINTHIYLYKSLFPYTCMGIIAVVQSLSCVQVMSKLCPTICNLMDCSTRGSSVLHYLLEFAQIHIHWVDDAIWPSLPLLPTSPKYWSFSNSPSHEYSGLISFRIYYFDLLAVQRTLKESSLIPQFKSINPLVFSSYIHTWLLEKTVVLTIWTFVSKVMSLLFNMLSRFVIAFLSRNKCLLFSWLKSPSAMILEPKKIKFVTASIFPPSICCEVIDAMILVFWMLRFKPAFTLSSFTLIKRIFSSSSLFTIRVVSSAYLRLLIFLPAILIPACDSSSWAFHMMYSAYKLNKQGDNIQPWHTPFPI